ncbi:MAG: ABC transporter substrate-binding protein [Fibrobacterota bacterium]
MRNISRIVFVLSLLTGLFCGVTASNAEIDSLVDAGEHAEALALGDSLITANEATDTLAVTLMEAALHTNDYEHFDTLYNYFDTNWPESDRKSRAYYLLGIRRAKQKEFPRAFTAFNRAAKEPGVTAQRQKILRKNMEKLLEKFLTFREIDTITADSLVSFMEEPFAFHNALKHAKEKPVAADSLQKEFTEKYPDTDYDTSRITQDRNVDDRKPTSGLKVALLIPRSGQDSTLGASAEEAVRMAAAEHAEKTGKEFKYRIVDTRSNSVATAHAIRELIRNDVDIIIGPLMSNTAVVAASILMEHPDIIMITPTATEGGLAALGENIFQLNITPRVIASRIAEYSVKNLGIDRFIVLSELTEYGRQVSRHFIARAQELGATIEVEEYFSPKSSDHGTQFRKIKQYYARKSLGIDTGAELNYAQKKAVKTYVEDSTVHVPGLFMPSDVSSAVKLAAQVKFYNFNTQILGTNSWDNTALILDGGKYVDNAIFSTDYNARSDQEQWENFASRYSQRFGHAPQRRIVPLFYDAARILLTETKGRTRPADIRRTLGYIDTYSGISGRIDIDGESGANNAVMIRKVSGKIFIRID